MAYYIKQDVTNMIGIGTVYYQGDDNWSIDIADKKSFSTKAKATAEIAVLVPQPETAFIGIITAVSG